MFCDCDLLMDSLVSCLISCVCELKQYQQTKVLMDPVRHYTALLNK